MAGQNTSGAAPDAASIPPSPEGEIEATLASIRRLTAERSGLAMPPWTGHERSPQPSLSRPELQAAPFAASMVASPAREASPEPAPVERPAVRGAVMAPSSPPLPAAAGRPGGASQDPERPGALVLTPDCRVPERGALLGTLPLRSPVSVPGAALDEAALRALVAETVREELRGPLGRSLTGTVRKLVRQEVRRVLAERDFG